MVARFILILLCLRVWGTSSQIDGSSDSKGLPHSRSSGSKSEFPAPGPEAAAVSVSEQPRTEQSQLNLPLKGLTTEQKVRFEIGKELYVTVCGACHQPHGDGQVGLAPPLRDSEWSTGSPGRLVRITLQGVRGPITVRGEQFDLEMPPLWILEDEQIASVLTYIRREWGHTADPIDPPAVARIRAETEERLDPWTAKELLEIP